jgi:uncharacterized protein (DUF433 family)
MNGTGLYSDVFGPLGQRQVVHQRTETEYSIEKLLQPEKERMPQPHIYWPHSNFEYLHRKLSASSDEVRNAVVMDVRIMHGNPVFRGTRIPIYEIIEELADGTTLREIVPGYPSLTVEQIQHGLDFAASLLRIYDEQVPD